MAAAFASAIRHLGVRRHAAGPRECPKEGTTPIDQRPEPARPDFTLNSGSSVRAYPRGPERTVLKIQPTVKTFLDGAQAGPGARLSVGRKRSPIRSNLSFELQLPFRRLPDGYLPNYAGSTSRPREPVRSPFCLLARGAARRCPSAAPVPMSRGRRLGLPCFGAFGDLKR